MDNSRLKTLFFNFYRCLQSYLSNHKIQVFFKIENSFINAHVFFKKKKKRSRFLSLFFTPFLCPFLYYRDKIYITWPVLVLAHMHSQSNKTDIIALHRISHLHSLGHIIKLGCSRSIQSLSVHSLAVLLSCCALFFFILHLKHHPVYVYPKQKFNC